MPCLYFVQYSQGLWLLKPGFPDVAWVNKEEYSSTQTKLNESLSAERKNHTAKQQKKNKNNIQTGT